MAISQQRNYCGDLLFFVIQDGLLALTLAYLYPVVVVVVVVVVVAWARIAHDSPSNCLAEAIEAMMADLQRVARSIFSRRGFMPSRVSDASRDLAIKLRHLSGTIPGVLPDLCVGRHICATFPVPGGGVIDMGMKCATPSSRM